MNLNPNFLDKPGYAILKNVDTHLVRRLFLFILSVTALSVTQARQIDESRAREIAQSFFADTKGTGDSVQACLVSDSHRIQSPGRNRSQKEMSGQPSFYVFSNGQTPDSKGFVVVSGDDAVKPVIGWSDEAVYDAGKIPPQLVSFLEEYENLLEEVRAGRAQAAKSRGGEAVAPLIKTKWNQDEPYNRYTPKTYYGNNTPTGCVATAMAQVMKHFNYPPKGNGVIPGSYYAPEDLDLGKSVYDWDNMLNNYFGKYSDTEAAAVARLMYDAGRSVEMSYEAGGSGAYDTFIAGAMYKYFNYDSSIAFKMRDYYDSQTWIDMIRGSLLRGEPVIYGGASNSDGHEFVCDGIDSDDYLHINWGWSGYCDGYFDLNAFEPYGVGIGGGDGNYYKQHGIVLNIRPGDPDADHSDYIRPPMVMEMILYANSYQPAKPDLSVKIYNNSNSDRNARSIGFIVDLYDSDKKRIVEGLTTDAHRYLLRANYISWADRIACDLSGLADGDYFISVRYNADKDNPYWYPQKYDYVGDFQFAGEEFVPVKVKDGKAVIEESREVINAEAITIESVDSKGVVYDLDTSPEINVTLRNDSPKMIASASLNVYCTADNNSAEALDFKNLESNGYLSISEFYGGATRTLPVTLGFARKLEPGKYRLIFVCDGKILKTESDCVLEVTPTPTSSPLLMLSRLSTADTEQSNSSTGSYMNLSFRYLTPGDWAYWYSDEVTLQLWAYNAAMPEEHFLISDIENTGLSYSPERVRTANINSYPDLKWKEPGTYRMYLKYKMDDEWVTIPGDNNLCDFVITTIVPVYDYVELAALAEINGGNPVEIGKEFEVKLKFKSPTGIKLDERYSYIAVTPTPQDYWTVYSADWEPDVDKWELQPGETCEMKMNLCFNENWAYSYEYDLHSIVGKKLLINPVLSSVFDEEYSGQAYIVYNEYIQSLYFTPVESSGISDIRADDRSKIDFSLPYKVFNLNGMLVGNTVENLTSGFYIICQDDKVTKFLVK